MGAIIEQKQKDGTVRPLYYMSRSTFPNEQKWSATELECGAIVWAIKKNRTLFYGIPFEIYSDHQPLKNLASLANKVNRVQRWFDFLSAYTYTLNYRPGKLNGNADLLSRLPLPATEQDASPDMRLTDPADVDVCMIGASGIMPARIEAGWGRLPNSKQSGTCGDFVVGERHQTRPRPLTTDESSRKRWQVIQQTRDQNVQRLPKMEMKGATVWPDNTPLVDPRQVVSGQWEPCLILHACPITEIGRKILGIESSQQVHTSLRGEVEVVQVGAVRDQQLQAKTVLHQERVF